MICECGNGADVECIDCDRLVCVFCGLNGAHHAAYHPEIYTQITDAVGDDLPARSSVRDVVSAIRSVSLERGWPGHDEPDTGEGEG